MISKIDYKKTGQKIRNLRKIQGLTIQQLCQELDYSEERSVRLLENGEGLTYLMTLCRLVAIFNVPASQILMCEEDRELILSSVENERTL